MIAKIFNRTSSIDFYKSIKIVSPTDSHVLQKHVEDSLKILDSSVERVVMFRQRETFESNLKYYFDRSEVVRF